MIKTFIKNKKNKEHTLHKVSYPHKVKQIIRLIKTNQYSPP